MKLSSDLPRWVAVPLRLVLYLFVIFILYNIAAFFVMGRLSRNVAECSAGSGGVTEALAHAKRVVGCIEHKNSLLEDLAFRRIRSAIDAMPNHPGEFVGKWSSNQPRCHYEFELRETGAFVAEPRSCSISNQTYMGQWGVYEGQMVWLYAVEGPWRFDINPMDVVDKDFFLLTEQDGTRTRFTRIGPITVPETTAAQGAPAEAAPVAANPAEPEAEAVPEAVEHAGGEPIASNATLPGEPAADPERSRVKAASDPENPGDGTKSPPVESEGEDR